MALSAKSRQQLKAKAHPLKPVVYIGTKKLTANVIKELEHTLEDHELIKVRIQENERDARVAIYNEICTATGAEPVQLIGKVCVVYRKRKEV